jgi:hypothetical protein
VLFNGLNFGGLGNFDIKPSPPESGFGDGFFCSEASETGGFLGGGSFCGISGSGLASTTEAGLGLDVTSGFEAGGLSGFEAGGLSLTGSLVSAFDMFILFLPRSISLARLIRYRSGSSEAIALSAGK